MSPVGRPPSVRAPPCPRCGAQRGVTSHGLLDTGQGPRRAFRCGGCARVFVPGEKRARATPALRTAVIEVRRETGAPYRLIADAVTRHLGVALSHTTVGAWCRNPAVDRTATDGAACEYLSILWALRCQLQDESRAGEPARSA